MTRQLRNIRLEIEYDGTDFAGWARQPGLPTIESSLLEVLGRVCQEEVSLSVAGRTDAGVHARGQVANFHTSSQVDPGRLRRSANQMLPGAIVVKSACDAPPDFDARGSARSRTYSYSVLNRPWPSPFRRRFVHFHAGKLDLELMKRAAGLVRGRHDFTAFTPTVTEHNHFHREVRESVWSHESGLLVYRITANAFLRNMIRVLVGTMIEIGRGYRPLADLEDLLKGAGRPAAGITAPPGGLCLEEIEY